MKVLEIYPNHCWSLHGPDAETILKLRAAVSLADEEIRELALQQIPDGEAFRFVGDPTTFTLGNDFFDEVRLTYTPADVATRVQLRQCIRRWSKNEPKVSEELEIRSDAAKKVRLASYFEELLQAGRRVFVTQ